MTGLDECLHTLCTGDQDSLPYADADVVGIGVSTNFPADEPSINSQTSCLLACIMQCIFLIILWFIFSGLKMRNFLRHVNRRKVTQPARTNTIDQIKQPQSHQSLFNDFIQDFHTAQCCFSGTIQVAALSYGIFTTDMLITFLLIPLATNGVLPVAFTLFLLYAGDKQFRPHVVLLISVC
jgi:hypothetical protein